MLGLIERKRRLSVTITNDYVHAETYSRPEIKRAEMASDITETLINVEKKAIFQLQRQLSTNFNSGKMVFKSI